MRRWIFLSASLLIAGVLAAASSGYYIYQHSYPSSLEQSRDVVIPPGGTHRIIDALYSANLLEKTPFTTLVFKAAVYITRKQGVLHAAELTFPAHASIKQILYVLRHGKPVLHEVTFPEGLSAAQIETILNNAPFLTGSVTLRHEAEILPQTYGYIRDMQRSVLVEKMKKAMIHTVARVWAERDQNLPLHTSEEMVILASIVEKETALPAERPKVARVFLNRLQQGMKLQSDPTVIYALVHGQHPLGRPLTHADLIYASPYNTYVIAGLPPQPICAPGIDSLTAVAHPAQGAMLYFVGDGQGGHYFAESLQDHNKNVNIFRKNHTHLKKVQPSH